MNASQLHFGNRSNAYAAGRQHLLDILANSISPTTIAAILVDLAANDQIDGADQKYADAIATTLNRQLVDMLGAEGAEEVLDAASGEVLDGLSRENDTDQISSHLLESIATTVAY